MSTKKQNITYIQNQIGWIYRDLRWLTEKESERKRRQRDRILRSMLNKVNSTFNHTKIYCGDLSPGCLTCGEGAWSCMFINSLCTANCFFCPQDRTMKKEILPNANGIKFNEPDIYIDYLEKFGFRGVGFTGGETMLVFEKLLLYLIKIKKKFGKKIYLWIYTNGDLLNTEKLKKLKGTGLDEIRLNISARNYDLQSVALATKFINTVTVEIPAIPEDYEVLKKSILKMKEIGVNHLNIHQLLTTEYNYKNFINRKYTFLHLPGVPIFESEITALKLIRYAVDKNISLPINYCSQCYKKEFQGRGTRRQASSLIIDNSEEETSAGYIRHLSVKGSSANIRGIAKILSESKCEKKLWRLDNAETEISLHYSVLKYINLEEYKLIIRYFEVSCKENIGSQRDYKEIKLNANKKLFIEKKCLFEAKELSSVCTNSFYKLFIENMNERDVFKYFYENYNLRLKESINNMSKEAKILMALKTWEQTKGGFSEIY